MKKMMKKAVKKEPVKARKTHPKIVFTAIAALLFVILALFAHWIFILPAVLLWWVNKRAIKKHFRV
ncbi:MAG: hypothetical protein AABX10_03155 [Nanoarchaeota archaeon]